MTQNRQKLIPLKRILIKEELVALTGCYKKAILLGQMLYWSERIADHDKFIEEENIRRDKDDQIDYRHGWIYKSSEQLSDETMMGLSKSNIRRILNELIEKGWMSQRTNPKFKWDRTMQYRVNLAIIDADLQLLGYNLEGFKRNHAPCSKIEHAGSKTKHRKAQNETCTSSKIEHRVLQNRTAIPEITTETIDYIKGQVSHLTPNTQKEILDYFIEGKVPVKQATLKYVTGMCLKPGQHVISGIINR